MDGSHASPVLDAPSRDVPPPAFERRQGGERRAAWSPFLNRDLSDSALHQPAAPTFSGDDVMAARTQGHALGHAAGLEEAEASRAAFETMTLAAVAGAMASARSEIVTVAEAAALALARAVVAAMQVSMPLLVERTAVSEIDAMIALVLPGLAREPLIRVLVAPDVAQDLDARLDGLSLEDRGRITVAGREGMAPGAVRIVWSAGHAERRPHDLWQQVMAAFTAQLDAPEARDTPDVE